MWLIKTLKNWFADEDGPTSVEYAVLLSLIISACMFAVEILGSNVSKKLTAVAASMDSGTPSPAGTSRSSGAAAPAAPSGAAGGP